MRQLGRSNSFFGSGSIEIDMKWMPPPDCWVFCAWYVPAVDTLLTKDHEKWFWRGYIESYGGDDWERYEWITFPRSRQALLSDKAWFPVLVRDSAIDCRPYLEFPAIISLWMNFGVFLWVNVEKFLSGDPFPWPALAHCLKASRKIRDREMVISQSFMHVSGPRSFRIWKSSVMWLQLILVHEIGAAWAAFAISRIVDNLTPQVHAKWALKIML